MSSGLKIDLANFRILLNETRELYLNLYGWYYMPSSVHKVLVHGCDIVDFFEFPIGQLSEDALEARHKEFRKIRLCNTRKTSRIDGNTDLIKTLLMTSDPELSTYRQATKKNKNCKCDNEIKSFIVTEEPPNSLEDLSFFSSISTNFSSDSESDQSD